VDILIPISEVKKLPRYNSKVEIKCKVCGCIFHSTKAQVLAVYRGGRKKKTLESCSRKCSAVIKGSKTRSLPEIILYGIISTKFPELEIIQNDRTVLDNGLEIDLYIPAYTLAIEVNGPTHYDNIYGELRLLRTELNDMRKKDKAEELGITMKIINISSIPEKELRTFIATFFELEIIPILV
jgi:hypothetical protein